MRFIYVKNIVESVKFMAKSKRLIPDNATYTISPLSKGFRAKCEVKPEISVYGDTRREALEKIESAIIGYEKVFKKSAK